MVPARAGKVETLERQVERFQAELEKTFAREIPRE